MQHKCDLKANRIKVFISSSMANIIYLEQRCAILSFIERLPFYHPFAIELISSPDCVVPRYTEKVDWADIIVLILQEDIRKGITKEFDVAIRLKKRIFAFIHSGKKTERLNEFIIEVRSNCTTSFFNDTRDLIDKIEESLLEDLICKYNGLYIENIRLLETLKSIQQKGGAFPSEDELNLTR